MSTGLDKALQRLYIEVLTLRKNFVDLSEALLNKGVLTREDLVEASEKVSQATLEVNTFVKQVNDSLKVDKKNVPLDELAEKAIQYGVHPSRFEFDNKMLKKYMIIIKDKIDKMEVDEQTKILCKNLQGLNDN